MSKVIRSFLECQYKPKPMINGRMQWSDRNQSSIHSFCCCPSIRASLLIRKCAAQQELLSYVRDYLEYIPAFSYQPWGWNRQEETGKGIFQVSRSLVSLLRPYRIQEGSQSTWGKYRRREARQRLHRRETARKSGQSVLFSPFSFSLPIGEVRSADSFPIGSIRFSLIS